MQAESGTPHLVRLRPRGDVIHREDCRYAQGDNALLWVWADAPANRERLPFIPWFRPCAYCKPYVKQERDGQ